MEILSTDISTFLNMVDTFYNNAWNRLIIFGAIIFAVVGIFVPIILQFLSRRIQQSKNIEMEHKLREEFIKVVDLEAKSIEGKDKNIIDNYFEEKDKILENKLTQLNRDISFSTALSFHNLGLNNVKEGNIPKATLFYISAGDYYLNADNENNLKIILGNLGATCLDIGKMKDSFEVNEVKQSLNVFISRLEEMFPDKRYSSEIKKIKKAILNPSKT